MSEEKEIVNRVAASGLITFDLEELYTPGERIGFDMRDVLYQGLILKEKEFREFVKAMDWQKFEGRLVAIFSSVDAIIPTWAFMLLSVALQPYAKKVFFGTLAELESELFHDALLRVDWERYRQAKVVIKGCSGVAVPASAYVEATTFLRPLVASLMYGEACSTVPLFKRRPSVD